MSLFENSQYQYRETFFVLFERKRRPTAAQFTDALADLGNRYEVQNVCANEDGQFESLTLLAPYDNAAMDITYVEGEDVTSQVEELNEKLRNATLTGLDIQKLSRLGTCDARFEIYHFEQVVDDDDEGLDPGSLLIVQESLAKLTDGIGVDPQAETLM